MSHPFDETSADVPVRDSTVTLSRPAASPHADASVYYNARARHESHDISRVSREELEDRFLRLHEENRHLKQHIHHQDDKIKKLGTKLMRLVKDRGRMEQLAAGGGQLASRVRDVEMEEMIEELQDKVRALQMENERLKQRLLVSKQQLFTSQRRTPYSHVQPRVNTGLKKMPDASSPQTRPKSSRSVEGGGRPRFGHSLLEEARAEIRNLENVIEMQRSQTEEAERQAEVLQDELRRREAEYEQEILQLRQQQTSKLRSHVSDNVTMIKLQKQLTERSNAVTELEGRFLQLQESQRTLKASHEAAMVRVDELTAHLKEERMKSLDLEKRLQASSVANVRTQQLQERLSEVEQERDVLKENNEKLINSAFDVSQQQKWRLREQQLKLQIAQLETALKADLVDKNEILDKIKAEREASEKLKEDNKKLNVQFLEQKQQLEELNGRLKFSVENGYDAAELTEALLLIKTRKAQKEVDFLKEVGEATGSLRELRAAHAETIQELQKTRNILNMESNISKDLQAELEAVLKKTDADRAEYERKLERQARLLDARAAKIHKLEAQLKEIAYGTKTFVFRPDAGDDEDSEAPDESFHPECGENLLELQIVGATLSPAALELLGDSEPSTFCTYAFYLFELHSTPVVTGRQPKYGYTSKYVVTMDERFLDYVHRGSVAVELHQALGLDWKTVASAQLRLQQLLEHDGKIHGSVPLVGASDELRSFGSLDYWLRLRVPMAETVRLFREKAAALDHVHSALKQDSQPCHADGGSWNQLYVMVQRCSDLPAKASQKPSPYVVYKFSDFPDYPTATVNDCCHPHFDDVKSYSVSMDAGLDGYLRSECLHFYVFNFKEERMDEYLGKVAVALLPLVQGQEISGVFELTNPHGLPAGRIEVTLRWKLPYVSPSGSISTTKEPELFPRKKMDPLKQELYSRKVEDRVETQEEKDEASGDRLLLISAPPEGATSQAPLPKLRQKTLMKETKRVKFVDPTAPDDSDQEEDGRDAAVSAERTVSPVVTATPQKVPSPAVQSAEEEEDNYDDDTDEDEDENDEDDDDDEEEDEQSHFSEGQLVPASSQSDDSEISEDIVEEVEEEAPTAGDEQSRSTQSDSDDCIVQGPAAGRKRSQRMRVEVLSLSLRPEGRLARDSGVVRLFVEFSLLDLPTEETPMSLPKPPPGRSINYNYSKVIPVDAEENGARRQLLRAALRGRNPQMERIRFTVVSEPPEEEEQEKECEDVGVAFVRIGDILEQRRDLIETRLNLVDVEDGGEVLGHLTVTVEGLEALRAIMEEQDRAAVSSQLPST